MDLAIPMGWKNNSKEVVKGSEKLYIPTNFLKKIGSKMLWKSMSTKHKIMWNLKLDNTCDETLEISKYLKD
jgi:hypothetical protein